MFETCLAKQNRIKEVFNSCKNEEERYSKIIELGKNLPPISEKNRIQDNIVKGCQSTVYLYSFLNQGAVYFEIESDALISAGLAALLTLVYAGETPEAILKCPPTYLEELGISASLTPNRANGLYSIHLRMKQDALKLLINDSKQK